MPQQSKEAKNRRTNKKRDIQKDVFFLLVRVVIQNFLKKPVISTVFKADE